MIAPERAIPLQESVDPDRIKLDPELQSRELVDERIVSEYAAAMADGAAFPPVVLYYDGKAYWCADGWHRVLAARAAGASEIDAEIRQGARRDALRHALGANASHGVRRTSADKRRAVLLALADEEWAQLSDREIARLCVVSHTFVAGLRRPRPESGGNVATPPSPVASAPINSLALAELVRCARECLDYGHRGVATSEALRSSVEKRLATNLTAPEWVAALERGEIEGRWATSSDGRIQSGSPRPVTAPPAPNSPIPRSEREADGGGQDLRTSPVGSAPTASLSSAVDSDDTDIDTDTAAREEDEDDEDAGWVECDRCDGSGHHPNAPKIDCTACSGKGGWYDEPQIERRPSKARDEDDGEPKPSKPRPSALPPSELQAPISEREGYDGDSWGTPADVIEDARAVLGEIDLDPASNEAAQRTVRATRYHTKADSGLAQPWSGRVWLNPPFSYPLVAQFTEKLIAEHKAGNVTAAIVLVNNTTDTRWFHALLRRFPVCFTEGRLAFNYADGSHPQARQGQAIFYLGPDVAKFCEVFGRRGTVVCAVLP